MTKAAENCENCEQCPIRQRCKEICETIETLLPSMESGRVDFEDLPRIYEGRIITNLILDNEDILTDRQREVVRLYYRESLLQQQIGTQLNITQQAVASTLKAVRTKYMRMFSQRRKIYEAQSQAQQAEIQGDETMNN